MVGINDSHHPYLSYYNAIIIQECVIAQKYFSIKQEKIENLPKKYDTQNLRFAQLLGWP